MSLFCDTQSLVKRRSKIPDLYAMAMSFCLSVCSLVCRLFFLMQLGVHFFLMQFGFVELVLLV